MHKKLLSETFIVTGTVEKESFLKLKQIENHCLSNFTLGNRMTNDQFWHLDDYISVPYHQHIQWFQDYVRDHYREQYETTLMPTTNNSIRG